LVGVQQRQLVEVQKKMVQSDIVFYFAVNRLRHIVPNDNYL